MKNERNKQKYRRKLHDEITTLSGSLRTKRLNGDLEIGQIENKSLNDLSIDIKRFRFDRKKIMKTCQCFSKRTVMKSLIHLYQKVRASKYIIYVA